MADVQIADIGQMIPRTIYDADHEAFRTQVRRFFETEVVPHHEKWEEQGMVDREIWTRAGELGFLCVNAPEEYGGAGGDRRYSAILAEEQVRAGSSGVGFGLHSDLVANYIINFGTEEQKQYWIPKMVTGEKIGAIAMTEPGAGSDLQGMKCRAVSDGDDYIINGSKIFITNGYMCDFAVVAVVTGDADKGAENISLIIIEAERDGFTKGKPLKKIGLKSQDTCELFFNDVRLPKSNLLGNEGDGFIQLMKELAWERMMIAIICIQGAETCLADTIAYTKERQAFGKPISAFQNTRFKLAEMRSEIQIGRVYVDRCMELILKKELGIDAAAAAKYWTSDLLSKVVDECLQLHGGYGYMMEYPVARAYVDSRINRIYGGTNEIMKEIISRML